MLRTDGSYTFYHIQHKGADGWGYSNLDHFGHPDGFNASGACWQKIGENATFDFSQAKAGLKWISKKHPKYKFRLMAVDIIQRRTPVAKETR